MKISTALFMTASLMTLASCAKQTAVVKKPVSEIQAASLLDQGKPDEAASVYSRIGELLLTNPAGVIHANEMFNKALSLNKNDPKANLYSSAIAPALLAQGFTRRFNSILNDKQRARLKEIEERTNAEGIQELIDFATTLSAGKTNVRTYKEAKKVLQNELLAELIKSTEKINAIKVKNFSIGITRAVKKGTDINCEQIDQNWTCTESSKAPMPLALNVDQYDLQALRATYKTYETELRILTLLNVDDLEAVVNQSKKKDALSDREATTLLKKYPALFKIDSKADLVQLFNQSESILNDFLDFASMRETLCENSDRTEHIAGQICVSENEEDQLKEIITLLAGPNLFTLGLDENGREVEILLNLRAWEKTSFTGLQDLLPDQFDEEGRALDLKDKTFGGLFPNGDFLEKLKQIKKSEEVE